jgi:hypothetical protein
MLNLLTTLFKNQDGATAIEYGLIAALIAIAAVVSGRDRQQSDQRLHYGRQRPIGLIRPKRREPRPSPSGAPCCWAVTN